MKYKGIELKPITTSQIIDPPREMVVWSDVMNNNEPQIETVYAVVKVGKYYSVITSNLEWGYCAEIPKELKPRRATHRELAKWLAQGNGETTNEGCSGIFTQNGYEAKYENAEVSVVVKVRKWKDTDWHEPTIDYLGIKE